jgi:hypothetical protein
MRPEYHILDFIPFIGMAVRGDQRNRPLITRLIETSIPGIAVALILMYSTGKQNDLEISHLKGQITQLTQDIRGRDDKFEAFQMMVMGKLSAIEGDEAGRKRITARRDSHSECRATQVHNVTAGGYAAISRR